jgi:hypothetical protein
VTEALGLKRVARLLFREAFLSEQSYGRGVVERVIDMRCVC